MHGLIGQRAEFGAERRHHPAGQIKITPFRVAEMLLDGDHLLLADEAVPAAERLGVMRRVGVIGRHVLAHDFRAIFRDIEAGRKTVLGAHAGDGLGVNAVPGSVTAFDQPVRGVEVVLIGHGFDPDYATGGRPNVCSGVWNKGGAKVSQPRKSVIVKLYNVFL